MAETVSYNGIDLEVTLSRTKRYSVYTEDGAQYKYTHWIVDVDALFNPQATSVGRFGVPQKGVLPAVTDVNVRKLLTTPRRKLVIRNGDGNIILTSPQPGVAGQEAAECDQKLGPIPSEICSIEQIIGTKTFRVRFVCETWVAECSANPVILAHRWSVTQDTDRDHYAVRLVEGEGVFNPAALLRLGFVPDQYRQDLFHPVPLTYQREAVKVVADADDCTFRYAIIDRERPVDFPPNMPTGATYVDCVQSGWFQQGGISQAMFGAMSNPLSFLGWSIGAAAGGVSGLLTSGMPGSPGVGGGATFGALYASGQIGNVLPKYHYSCVTQCWGDRRSRRGGNDSLQNLAVGVTMSRLQINPAWTMTEMALTHDAAGKFVEFKVTATHGVEGGFANGPQNMNDIVSLNQQEFARRFFNEFVQDESLRVGANGPTNASGVNPAFPNSRGSRGTSLESVFAQALSDPCQIPPAPFNSRAADRTFRVGG